MKIDEKSVTIANNDSGSDNNNPIELESDIIVLTTGIEQCSLINNLKQLQKDKFGRIYTSPTLQCLGYPNLFALGDCSAIQIYSGKEESNLPKTAQVAMQQSDVVARNLYKRTLLYGSRKFANYIPTDTTSSSINSNSQVSELSKEIHTKRSFPDELDTFRFIPLGEMLSLGETDAAITGLSGLVKVDGAIASAGRRLVYAARMPTNYQKVNAVFNAGIITAANILTKILKSR